MNASPLPFAELREQALALRRAGKSRPEIKQILGITSNRLMTKLVAGEPPANWNSSAYLRAQARQLREQRLTYQEIADQLGVSKTSVSLWVRGLPRPERLSYEEWRRRLAEGKRLKGAAQRQANEARRELTRAAAAAEIGPLTDRELIVAGAIAYWCEGAKNKPYRRDDHVAFVNSDPGLITFFLGFLKAAGVTCEDLIFRVQIHEQADASAAQRFWLGVTNAREEQFRKPTLKRHIPKTARPAGEDDYHGCLRIDVRRGSSLYRRIEGWARAAMPADATGADPSARSPGPLTAAGNDPCRSPADSGC